MEDKRVILNFDNFDFFNPYPAKLMYLNLQPLEVMSRYRDPQPQVVENYSYLFNFTNHGFAKVRFIPNNSDLFR